MYASAFQSTSTIRQNATINGFWSFQRVFTPEHPFSVTERSDGAERPKPVGHEDLNSNWIGAGHLKIGDKIKQADGTTGVVAYVTTVQQTQEMFNLTVDEVHTFYFGRKGWLVHNCGPTVMNGATLDHLTPGQIAQIQKYADASGATVKLFGSKASGASHLEGIPVGPHSDFDFLIEGANRKWMNRALDPRSGYSLPKRGGGGQIERGFESGIDLWRPEDFTRRNWTLDDSPYIIFTPKPK